MKFHETSHRRSGAEKTGKRRRARGDGRWTTRPCARLALMKQARNKARAPRCLLPRARTVIPDDEAAGERGKDQAQQKRIMPLKRPNLDVRAEFDLETNGAGKTQAKCKHCKEIVQTAKTVNTARLRTHLVSVCQKAPGDIKERAYESGQGVKKAKKTLAQLSCRPMGRPCPKRPCLMCVREFR